MKTAVPDAFVADCPTREILTRLASKWTILVLSALQDGPMRFGGLQRRIEGISQKMLTKTLRALERDALVTRTVYEETPLRVEYALTPLGESVARRVGELKHWVEEHMADILLNSRQR